MKYLAALLLLASSQAFAVVYEFTGTGYQAIKNSQNNWECYSWSQYECDLEPGNYTLYNFSTNPNTLTDITIEAEPVVEGPVVVREICDIPASTQSTTCTAVCPAGKVVTSVLSCYAIQQVTENDIGTGFRTQNNKLLCHAEASDYDIGIGVVAVCN